MAATLSSFAAGILTAAGVAGDSIVDASTTSANANHEGDFDEQLAPYGDRIVLTHGQLDEKQALQHVRDAGAGASVLFVGTTRNEFEGKSVERLEYTAYSTMARKMMTALVRRLHEKFEEHRRVADEIDQVTSGTAPTTTTAAEATNSASVSASGSHRSSELKRIYLAHRLGRVDTEEASILVCVSSAHRKAAFVICEEALEEVKRSVPIWKKEVYANEHEGEAEWKGNAHSYWDKGRYPSASTQIPPSLSQSTSTSSSKDQLQQANGVKS